MRQPAEMTTREADGIVFRLRRSPRARRLRLVVAEDGLVTVTLPERVAARYADQFVIARSAWVRRHQARLAAERARHEARGPVADGGSVPFAGVRHRLEVRELPGSRLRSRVEHDEPGEGSDPVIRVWRAPGEGRPLADLLEGWLRGQARAAVERRIAARAPQLGVRPVAVAIRDQRSRWGSASSRGRLSFSWRLILAPPAVLDYVVVHELAHLRVLGHNPRFWRLVVEVVPEADLARRWLRDHARELRWTLTEGP